LLLRIVAGLKNSAFFIIILNYARINSLVSYLKLAIAIVLVLTGYLSAPFEY
jgi:hypothetical protein